LEYSTLEKHISKPRLDRYYIAAGSSKTKAQKLYRANLRASQAFYPVLNLFETSLRNVINAQLTSHFGDPDWIINEKAGFMSNPSLAGTRFFLKKSIDRAEGNIRRHAGTITAGKVVAEQTLGFWTSLFDTHHYRLLTGTVIHCFHHKPNTINRNQIGQKLTRIRKFRNRIYHNEPICFNRSVIDFSTASDIKKEIFDVLAWIDPNLKDYVAYFDGIDSKINSANTI
jgi:hypothetical protein